MNITVRTNEVQYVPDLQAMIKVLWAGTELVIEADTPRDDIRVMATHDLYTSYEVEYRNKRYPCENALVAARKILDILDM